MTVRRGSILVSLFVMLLLAAGGVASALMMAPTQDEIARIQIAALGQTPDAICGDLSKDNQHCPICHIDPQPPTAGPARICWHFIPSATCIDGAKPAIIHAHRARLRHFPETPWSADADQKSLVASRLHPAVQRMSGFPERS